MKKNYTTIRCSPGSVVSILNVMTQPMKDRISELGFKHILGFSFGAIDDRSLVMFLMDHIEVDPLRIVVGGIELPISPDVVHCVLRIPEGGASVPTVSMADRASLQTELREKCDEEGMEELYSARQGRHSKKYEDLKPSEVDRWVIEEFAKRQNADDWTLRCFFMTLFDALLFPTSSLVMSGNIYSYCKDLDNIGNFDWYKAVVDDLAIKVKKWKNCRKTTTSAQGCAVLFLVRISFLCCLVVK